VNGTPPGTFPSLILRSPIGPSLIARQFAFLSRLVYSRTPRTEPLLSRPLGFSTGMVEFPHTTGSKPNTLSFPFFLCLYRPQWRFASVSVVFPPHPTVDPYSRRGFLMTVPHFPDYPCSMQDLGYSLCHISRKLSAHTCPPSTNPKKRSYPAPPWRPDDLSLILPATDMRRSDPFSSFFPSPSSVLRSLPGRGWKLLFVP